MERRKFLLSAAAAVLPAISVAEPFQASPFHVEINRLVNPASRRATRSLNVLFLGGTNFVGPPTVQRFIDRGHHVTLFNRGKTNPYLFPQLKKLQGNRFSNRDNGLQALRGEESWDIVVDTWRETPLAVDASIDLLNGRVDQYIYVSSIAVYGNKNYEMVSPITESTPLPTVERPKNFDEEVGYRRSKILADNAVLRRVRGRSIVVRPHGIYGYYMGLNTDGQAYWPIRLDRGGDILCPGDGLDGMQYIDVIDLAEFIVHSAEKNLQGPFNVSTRLTFRDFLMQLQAISSNTSTLHWVGEEALEKAGIRPYSNLPLWVPRDLGPGFNNISDIRAVEAGLRYRPFADTFIETLAGIYDHRGKDLTFETPIVSNEKEKSVLLQTGAALQRGQQ